MVKMSLHKCKKLPHRWHLWTVCMWVSLWTINPFSGNTWDSSHNSLVSLFPQTISLLLLCLLLLFLLNPHICLSLRCTIRSVKYSAWWWRCLSPKIPPWKVPFSPPCRKTCGILASAAWWPWRNLLRSMTPGIYWTKQLLVLFSCLVRCCMWFHVKELSVIPLHVVLLCFV